jgi:hypothetical protein
LEAGADHCLEAIPDQPAISRPRQRQGALVARVAASRVYGRAIGVLGGLPGNWLIYGRPTRARSRNLKFMPMDFGAW